MLNTAKLLIFFGLFLFPLIFVQTTFAQQVLPGSTNRNEKAVNPVAAENKSDKTQIVQNKAGTAAAVIKNNALTQTRLKVCQTREARISNRFTNLKSLGAQVQQAYEGHIARVDYYYNNTLVPQGFVLQNYDELKADIETNQTAVNTAMEQVRNTGQDFSCNSEDPKGMADAFRLNMSEVIAANKEYKLSVRAFAVAVRDLAKESKDVTLNEESEVTTENVVDSAM